MEIIMYITVGIVAILFIAIIIIVNIEIYEESNEVKSEEIKRIIETWKEKADKKK
jgi:hypothetical protein